MPDGLGHTNFQVGEINVVPAQGQEFTDSQAGGRVEQDQSPLPDGELGEERLKFVQFEYIGNALPLCALANEPDRILVRPLVPHRVTEESAHDVPNLCFGSSCPLDTA